MLKRVAEKLAESTKLIILPKIEPNSFQTASALSGGKLFCKFCQRDVDWKRVDTCKDRLGSKACVENRENTGLHDGEISVKG